MHLIRHSCPLQIIPVLQISKENINVTQILYPSGDEAIEVIQKTILICSHPNRNEQKLLYKPLGMCDFHWMLVLHSLRLERGNTTWAVPARWFQSFVYLLQSWSCPLGILPLKYFAYVNLYAEKETESSWKCCLHEQGQSSCCFSHQWMWQHS